jgi:DNA-binding MarR family transcriptional regulator
MKNTIIKKEILTELIEDLFVFSEENKGKDYMIQDFLGFLNLKEGRKNVAMRKIGGKKENHFTVNYKNEANDISILLGLMYRYAKGYIKKALKRSRIRTADEFSFIITLMTYESLTKSELIRLQVMEKTSGAEVIRRLIQKGFITETEDPDDRRSLRISITEKGRKEIYSLLPVMSDVSGIIVGNLSEGEVNTLSYLLKKLDYFHNDIYMYHRNSSIDEIKALRAD